MSNVITFVPNNALTAKKNLTNFIKHSRAFNPFDVAIDFESTNWSLGASLNSRGRRNELVLSFKNLRCEEFTGFAKAYILYQQALSPTQHTGLSHKLAALQVIETALLKSGRTCPTDINGAVFDRSVSVLKSCGWSKGRNYSVGREIEKISAFLRVNRLAKVVSNWTNFLPVPDDAQIKIGPEFERNRELKLPEQSHLELLAYAFHRAKHKADIIATAAVALLLSQPSRISEVLTLPLDCIVPRADGKPGISLRLWPAKGGAPVLKPVALTMMDTAHEAVSRIERASAAARTVARHYEKNRALLYLDAGLTHLRLHKYLTFAEVGAILWGESFNRCHNSNSATTPEQKIISVVGWLNRRKIPFKRGHQFCKDNGGDPLSIRRVLFLDLQDAVISTLPPAFPIVDIHTGLKYSDALFLSRPNELSFTKKTIICSVVPVGYQNVADLISENSGRRSMYLRTEVKDEEHDLISIKSHQPRHFLNTLANAANMDGFDIAAWSGRKYAQQNSVYDHVSSTERADEMRSTVVAAVNTAAPRNKLGKYIPIRRENLSFENIRTAHLTDLGHCIHDFTMSPCLKFADHINCDEHEVIKGDTQTNENIRRALTESQKLLVVAQRAWHRGNNAAKIWLEHHQKRVDHLRDIIAILDDRQVEVGTSIRLTGGRVTSRVAMAPALVYADDLAVRSTES
jgi:hypothetical protein